MKKNLIIWSIALILVIVAVYTAMNYDRRNTAQKEPDKTIQDSSDTGTADNTTQPSGEEAADFTLTDLEGNKVSLKDFRGKKVYLNFWATWCPPCRQEMPDLEKIHRKYKDKDLVVLAVNIGENKATVEDYIKSSNLTFTVLLDTDQRVAAEYRINSIPQSYFIDREGRIAAKQIGSMSEAEMDEYVKLLE